MSAFKDNLEYVAHPRRPYHANGMLLDEADFLSEQDYHRQRLARALLSLNGPGTISGLNVTIADNEPAEVKVSAGLALDPYGRLMEVPDEHCLKVGAWIEPLIASDAGRAALLASFVNGSGGSPDHIRAHIFLRFSNIPQGKTPAFARANFDALNATTHSRLLDGFELVMIPGKESPVPQPQPDLPSGTPPVSKAARLAALGDAKRARIWQDGDSKVEGTRKSSSSANPNPADLDRRDGDILLAQLEIPTTLGPPLEPDFSQSIVVNFDDRLFSYSSAELAWLVK